MPPSDLLCSGDAGYCEHRRTTIGIIRTWNDHTVTAVDCDYLHCGCDKYCELYQRAPVGFIQRHPDATE